MPLVAQNPTNRVILGLMTFGPDESTGARITSLPEYNRCLDHFQAQGYNEVDTARIYVGGQQEAFTREARWKERGLKIATKCYPTKLDELGTECVDIFYLHAPDRSVPFEETLEACNDLHKQGKFVELGLSNYAAWEVAEIVITCRKNGWVQPSIYQAMYNAITRSIETELVPCCRKYSLDVVIYNPLAGGLFSGKYKSADLIPDQGRYSNTASSLGKMYRDRYFTPETFECLRLIEPVAEKHKLTLLETALRWCVHHSKLQLFAKDGAGLAPAQPGSGADGIIIGVSGFAQLEANLADLEKGPLPEEMVQALDQAWLISKATTPTYWR